MSCARGCLSPRYNKTVSNSDSRISSNNVAKIHIACMPTHYPGWIILPPASSQLLYGAVHDRTIIAGHAPTVRLYLHNRIAPCVMFLNNNKKYGNDMCFVTTFF